MYWIGRLSAVFLLSSLGRSQVRDRYDYPFHPMRACVVPAENVGNNPDKFAALKRVVLERHRGFASGPDSRLGIVLDVAPLDDGGVSAEWIASRREEGPPGIVHGGVQGILADAMAGWSTARWQAEQGGHVLHFPVTAEMALRFRRPVPTDMPLVLRAHVVDARPPRVTSEVVLGTAEEPRATVAQVVYHLLDREWFPNPYL